MNGRKTAGGNRQYSTVGREKYRNNGCGAQDEESINCIVYVYYVPTQYSSTRHTRYTSMSYTII